MILQGLQALHAYVMTNYSLKGLSTTQLDPMEVLSALQHAELRLGREFTKEEFVAGTIGKHMLPRTLCKIKW